MSDALAQAVAAEIRAEKGRQRVSGRELARRIELPVTTVSRWLRGDTPLGLDELYKMAAALDVDMIDIIRAAQVRVELPRLDSNQQPAGRVLVQVSPRFRVSERPERYIPVQAAGGRVVSLAARRELSPQSPGAAPTYARRGTQPEPQVSAA